MIREIISKYQNLNYLILGENSSLLTEGSHIMPDIEKYFKTLVKWLEPKLKEGNNTYIPPTNIFDGFNTFFDTINLTINITLSDTNTLSQQSTTKPQATPTLTANGKLDNIEINISVVSNREFVWFELASAFYHEMLHAYEDWNRIKESGCLSNLATCVPVSDYPPINEIRLGHVFGCTKLGQILFILWKTSESKFLNECIADYNELAKNWPRFQFKRLDNIIKSVLGYRLFVILDEYFNVLENIKNNEHQEKLLELFNDNIKDEYKDYRIKAYNDLLKLLKFKILLTQERFVSTISKLVSDNSINSMLYIE